MPKLPKPKAIVAVGIIVTAILGISATIVMGMPKYALWRLQSAILSKDTDNFSAIVDEAAVIQGLQAIHDRLYAHVSAYGSAASGRENQAEEVAKRLLNQDIKHEYLKLDVAELSPSFELKGLIENGQIASAEVNVVYHDTQHIQGKSAPEQFIVPMKVQMRRTGLTSWRVTGVECPKLFQFTAWQANPDDPYTPDYVKRSSRYSSVLRNAHTVQTMLESYSIDWGGRYPISVDALMDEAKIGSYFKQLINPFDEASPAVVDMSHPTKGAVGYTFDETTRKYHVRAWDENGELLKDEGNEFHLTNS
jgi:hypothetical protein